MDRRRAGGGESSTADFNPDYSYVRSDLRRIGILAASLFGFLILLSFLLP